MAGTKEEPLSVTEAVQVAKGQVAQIPALLVMGEVSGFRGPNAPGTATSRSRMPRRLCRP